MNQIEIKKRQVELASQMLGMIILLVLSNILGDNGMAYMAIAIESFMLLWTLTGARLADALGRLLRGRSAKGQFKNAARLRKNAMVMAVISGIIGSLAMLLLAGYLSMKLFGIPYSAPIIRLLAPVVLLRTVTAVFLGYFQGEGTELPSVISYMMRQVCFLCFSVLFSGIAMRYGNMVSALLKQNNFAAMYGGMGVAGAALISEALVLLFLFLVYQKSRKNGKRSSEDGMRIVDNFGSQFRALYVGLLPQILVAVLQHMPIWIGLLFFKEASVTELNEYGVLYGKFIPIIGILLLPVYALVLGNCYKTAGCVRREELRYAKGHFSGGVHIGVVYGMFFSVFNAVMAPQIAAVFCKTGAEAATSFLRAGSFIILFAAAGFYFSEILILLGGKFQVSGALVLYNIVFMVCMMIFMKSGKMGVLSLVYSGLISGAVYALVTWALLFYQIRLNIDWMNGIVIPAGSSVVIGLIMLFIGKAVTPHIGNLMVIILFFIMGLILYWMMLLMLRNFREQELNYIPGGKYVLKMGKLFRLY